MKVLFVNAIDPVVEVETRYPNLGLGYLVGSLRQHRIGKDACSITDRMTPETFDEFKPDILCLTAVSQNYHRAIEYARLAKKKGIPSIVGGIHVSMLPESLTDDFACACMGEGELTIVELLSLFEKTGKLALDDVMTVKGIAVRDGSRTLRTEIREHIDHLDSINRPARDLLKVSRHTYMFTSRGCPYNCVFCASTRFWKKIRYFTPEYVVDEIRELVENHGVSLISFFDDLFIADLSRLRRIVELLEQSALLRKTKFTCSARANSVNEETVRLLKRMNVTSVGMGLESGCDATLQYLKGPSATVAKNESAVRLLRKYGIAANASFVIGAPRESREDVLKTYHFIRKNPLCLFDVYVLTPYPGTAIWEYAKKKDLVSEDMDWKRLNVNFSQHPEDAIIVSDVLGRKEIQGLYRKLGRLRLLKNVINVWFTPQLSDLPLLVIKKLIENGSMFIRRLTSVR